MPSPLSGSHRAGRPRFTASALEGTTAASSQALALSMGGRAGKHAGKAQSALRGRHQPTTSATRAG